MEFSNLQSFAFTIKSKTHPLSAEDVVSELAGV